MLLFTLTLVVGCGGTAKGPDQTTLEGTAQLYVEAMANKEFEKIEAINATNQGVSYFIDETRGFTWRDRNPEDFEYTVNTKNKSVLVNHPEWGNHEELSMINQDGKWYLQSISYK